MSTTREVAIQLMEELSRIPDVSIAMCCEKEVVDILDKALQAERERAAKIAESGQYVRMVGGSTGDA
jgi:hypothetical protein